MHFDIENALWSRFYITFLMSGIKGKLCKNGLKVHYGEQSALLDACSL
jgi:hypothetical protein